MACEKKFKLAKAKYTKIGKIKRVGGMRTQTIVYFDYKPKQKKK